MENQLTAKALFSQENVRAKFQELMGKRASSFITSVLQIISSNEQLSKAEPVSIYNAAAVAATLDLPLNNSLGFAYIVPYNQKQKDGTWKQVAQFQIGYKGLIQLAQRSGLFKTIAASPIYEGQIVDNNPLTGIIFDFKAKKSDVTIGYAAYFSLINGFEKTLFMGIDELQNHGKKYSQTFKKNFGLWKDDFEAMATKTVLKLLLAKYAPLSIEMQKAVITDQAVIYNEDATEVSYVDNEPAKVDKAQERITVMIESAEDVQQLETLASKVDFTPEQIDLFNAKKEALNVSK